jgi:hypothetical protein
MKFSELRPEFLNPQEPVTIHNAWAVNYDCPYCKSIGLENHRIYVPLGAPSWMVSPESAGVDNVTISPSVRMLSGHECLGHWNVTNGEIIIHGDSCRSPDHHRRRRVIRLPTHLHVEHHGR